MLLHFNTVPFHPFNTVCLRLSRPILRLHLNSNCTNWSPHSPATGKHLLHMFQAETFPTADGHVRNRCRLTAAKKHDISFNHHNEKNRNFCLNCCLMVHQKNKDPDIGGHKKTSHSLGVLITAHQLKDQPGPFENIAVLEIQTQIGGSNKSNFEQRLP